MRLPRPITGKLDRQYLDTLLRLLERELEKVPRLINGKLYVNRNMPLVYLGDDGQEKVLGEDYIPPTEEPPASTDTGWQPLTLQNGWTDYGGSYGPPRYRKLDSGLVILEGLLKDGTTGTTTPMFTLPAGCRPRVNLIMKPNENSGLSNARVDILPDGRVTAHTVGTGWVSICFTFMASQ